MNARTWNAVCDWMMARGITGQPWKVTEKNLIIYNDDGSRTQVPLVGIFAEVA